MTETLLIIDPESTLIRQAFDLRLEVFVVEQGVPLALEIDEYDASATHIVVLQDDHVVATMRLLPYADTLKIGRVAVRQALRRQGIGTRMMRRGLAYAIESGFAVVMLDAQVDSMPFYQSLGFVAEGEVFDDAGIPHRRMVLQLR